MAVRTYKVGHSMNKDKVITAYFVTDAHDEKELDARPKAAEFPICQMYDDELQHERADKYAEYLNKLAEAARVASEQIHLVDILSRP